MFNPGNRREVKISRRQTAWQFLKGLRVEPCTCGQAIDVYERLETAEKKELERLGAHLVTRGTHLPVCPAHDPGVERFVAKRLQNGFPD